MMSNIIKISLLILLSATLSCKDTQEIYYNADTEETVNMSVLEMIEGNEDYSIVYSLLKTYQLDTLFSHDKAITLFIPNNEAFESDYSLFLDTLDALQYYISESYINAAHIQNEALIQTVGGKYVTISNTGSSIMYDHTLVNYESPLCSDGRFYGIERFVQPKPNLYEYIAASNDFYKAFIDQQDTSYLDPNSTRIGYDDLGNTIYDTLWISENRFETDYFPVSEELRDQKATLVLFTGEQMNKALEVVKEDLNLPSVEDIPSVWINDIMMPTVGRNSVFARELSPADFASGSVKNINGDSVQINANDISANPFQCSNGLAYTYTNFSIPEALYFSTDTIFGKDLLVKKNLTEYTWGADVAVSATPYIPSPSLEFNTYIGDEILSVPLNEAETFKLTTTFENMFPNTYLLICNVKTDPSAKFKIYANDQLLDITIKKGFAYGGTTTKDYIDTYSIGDAQSPSTLKYVSSKKYPIVAGFRTFEVLIENATEYGDINITLEYDGASPDNRDNRGLTLNYMTLESWNE